MQCIALDAHKRYTWALVEDERGKVMRVQRVAHTKGAWCRLAVPVALVMVRRA